MIDKHGLLVQADGDPGDSTHRSGTFAAISAMLPTLTDRAVGKSMVETIHSNCHVGNGIYIRHPEHEVNEWCHEPTNFSRDQASRVILAYAVNGKKEYIKEWLGAMAKRGFFHQNNTDPVENTAKLPDIMGPGEWRNVIRGLDALWAYPALLFLDSLFLLDLLLRKKWDGGSLILPDMYYACMKYPTPFAHLAKYIALNHTDIKNEIKHNHDPVNSNGCVEVLDAFKRLFGEL